jgi:hypothetical protein
VTNKSVSDLELSCAFIADSASISSGVKRAKSSFAFEEKWRSLLCRERNTLRSKSALGKLYQHWESPASLCRLRAVHRQQRVGRQWIYHRGTPHRVTKSLSVRRKFLTSPWQRSISLTKNAPGPTSLVNKLHGAADAAAEAAEAAEVAEAASEAAEAAEGAEAAEAEAAVLARRPDALVTAGLALTVQSPLTYKGELWRAAE